MFYSYSSYVFSEKYLLNKNYNISSKKLYFFYFQKIIQYNTGKIWQCFGGSQCFTQDSIYYNYCKTFYNFYEAILSVFV